MFRNQLKKKPGRLPSFLDIFWFLCFNFCNIIVVAVVVVYYFSSLLSRLKYNCSSYFRIILYGFANLDYYSLIRVTFTQWNVTLNW